MKVTTSSPTHRVGMTELEILASIHVLDQLRDTTGLRVELASLRVKLYNIYNKIESGIKLPDYIPIGRPESKINLGALGASQDEIDTLMNGSKSDVDGKVRNNSAEMDSATAAQLDWMIQCTQEESKNPPALEQFMKGGSHYEWNQESRNNLHEDNNAGNSSSGTNSAGSNGNSFDDIGTDVFIDSSSDVDLHNALLSQL